MDQETVNNILGISTLIIAMIAVLIVSHKTGLVAYSPWSLFDKNQKKFKIDQSKLGSYLFYVSVASFFMLAYPFVLTKDIQESLIYGTINTVVIAYALLYLVLLKEKKKSKNS
ncbi:MAG TPA: hypothetical protein VK674_05545 [Candidatus Limnocylindria bacterium]|nr:hypothetical protein [Candidatus Limnocylindria bacterium]